MAEPVEFKVTASKPPGFYLKSAKNFLQGTSDKERVDAITINGLGNAVSAAALVAALLEKDGIGSIAKTETCFPQFGSETGSTAGSGVPQVKILVTTGAVHPRAPRPKPALLAPLPATAENTLLELPEGDEDCRFVRRREDLPKLSSSATVEVFYMEAAISVGTPSTGEKLNAWHSGIGMVVETPGEPTREMALQLYAKDGMFSAILPVGVSDAGPLWKNTAVIGYNNKIDSKYWTKRTRIVTAMGDAFNKYADWIVEFAKMNSKYELFTVISPAGDVLHNETICDTFAHQSILFLKSLGVSTHQLQANRNYHALITNSTPIPVDLQDPDQKQELLQFYQELQTIMESLHAAKLADVYKAYAKLSETTERAKPTVFIQDQKADRYLKVVLESPFVSATYGPML